MKEVVEHVKDIISPFLGNRKVTAIDVADAPCINVGTLRTKINRDSIPYDLILGWCYRTGLDPMKIFFKKGTV